MINKTIEAGVIFLLIFTPLAFGAVHVWAYSVMLFTVSLLMALWGIKLLLIDSDKKGLPAIVNILIFSFIGLIVFQLIPLPTQIIKYISPNSSAVYKSKTISLYPYVTKIELLKVLAYFGLFCLVIYNLTQKEQIKRIALVIVLLGCCEALYGLSGYKYIFGFEKKYYTDCATGTFINRNHFAGYLELALPFSIGFLIYYASRLPANLVKGIRCFIARISSEAGAKVILSGLAFMIMLLGVFFSRSRMGVISVSVSLSVVALMLMVKKNGLSDCWCF